MTVGRCLPTFPVQKLVLISVSIPQIITFFKKINTY